jgi:hypothetical protein
MSAPIKLGDLRRDILAKVKVVKDLANYLKSNQLKATFSTYAKAEKIMRLPTGELHDAHELLNQISGEAKAVDKMYEIWVREAPESEAPPGFDDLYATSEVP